MRWMRCEARGGPGSGALRGPLHSLIYTLLPGAPSPAGLARRVATGAVTAMSRLRAVLPKPKSVNPTARRDVEQTVPVNFSDQVSESFASWSVADCPASVQRRRKSTTRSISSSL